MTEEERTNSLSSLASPIWMTFISSGKPDMVFCQGSVRSSGGMNAANVGVRAAGERVRGVSLHMKVSGIAGRGLSQEVRRQSLGSVVRSRVNTWVTRKAK